MVVVVALPAEIELTAGVVALAVLPELLRALLDGDTEAADTAVEAEAVGAKLAAEDGDEDSVDDEVEDEAAATSAATTKGLSSPLLLSPTMTE